MYIQNIRNRRDSRFLQIVHSNVKILQIFQSEKLATNQEQPYDTKIRAFTFLPKLMLRSIREGLEYLSCRELGEMMLVLKCDPLYHHHRRKNVKSCPVFALCVLHPLDLIWLLSLYLHAPERHLSAERSGAMRRLGSATSRVSRQRGRRK